MKKSKLTRKNIDSFLKKCKTTDDKEFSFRMPIRDEQNPKDVTLIEISHKKLKEYQDELKYMLGQLLVFHSNNKVVIYEQLAFNNKKECWTENDPVALHQIAHLGCIVKTIGIFQEIDLPSGKKASVAPLPPVGDKFRVKPVFHREGPSLDD